MVTSAIEGPLSIRIMLGYKSALESRETFIWKTDQNMWIYSCHGKVNQGSLQYKPNT